MEVDPWSVELPMVDPETLLPTPEDAHRCEEMVADLELYEELCEEWGRTGRRPSGPLLWGKALERVEQHRGRWWAHNGEYAVPICYCPFCGMPL